MKSAAPLILALVLISFVSTTKAANDPITILPISVARDRVMVPASLNGTNKLSFLLDTGYTMTMLHPELVEQLQLRRAGEITIAGIAGEERAATYEGAVFQLGEAKYAPRRVAAVRDGASRRRRDGILGSGLFRQFVVMIDFQHARLTLFSPTNFHYNGPGEIIPLHFRRSSTPTVSAVINGTNGSPVRGEFEIDTGCDSGVCLGHDFITMNHLLNETETRGGGGKFGVGGSVKTRSGHLPDLQLGGAKIEKPQTDFFLEGSPVDPGLAGHIGIGALRRFKVIFDYSRQRMILERPEQQ